MANEFLILPVPASPGVGAWVDCTGMAPLKTIAVDGDTWAGSIGIEISNDGQVSATPLLAFTGGGQAPVDMEVSAQWMRVRVNSLTAPGTPTVRVAAAAGFGVFGAMNVPSGNGTGTPIDLSTGGTVNTFTVRGGFQGSLTVEVSADGTNFSPALLFTSEGVQTFKGTLSAARVRRSLSLAPSTISVAVGSSDVASSGGTVNAVTATAPITSSGGASPNIAISDSGVTPGTYTNATVTVDAKGRVTVASSGSAGGVTSVTGTAPIVSSGGATPAISLANTAVTPGTYNLATVTVDAQGRITAASSGSAGGVTSVTGTAPIVSSGGATPAISLANTAVAPGAYTNANITIDAQGRITAAANGSSTSGVSSVTASAPITSSGGATPNIALANTAVAPGAYTNANITIDAQGRITAAANGSSTSGVSSVTATAPITSSGGATPNIALANTAVTAGSYTHASITVDAQGRLTAAASGTAPVTSVTGTAPIVSSGGATPAISLANTAVAAGSYTHASITVDAQGRLTAASSGGAPLLLAGGTMAGTIQMNNNNLLGLKQAGFQSDVNAGSKTGAATPLADWSAGPFQHCTLTGNVTSSTFVDPAGVGRQQLIVIQDGTGGRTVVWPASVTWIGGSAPTLSTAPGAQDVVCFYWNGTGYLGQPVTTSSGVTSVTGTAPIVSSGGTTPALSLANTAVTPGSYTHASITVDAQGRLTAAASGTAPVTSVTGTAPIVSSGGTTPALSLANTAVAAGSYTLASITVDAQGRLTAAATQASTAAGLAMLTAATAVAQAALLGATVPTQGTNIPDANTTVAVSGGSQYTMPTATAARVITLGTAGSPLVGETIIVNVTRTGAFAVTIQDDAATSLLVVPASVPMSVAAAWNGTHFANARAYRIQ